MNTSESLLAPLDSLDVVAYSDLTREQLIERIRTLEERENRTTSPSTDSALRDSEERIRAIVNTAVEGIVTIDARGIVESLNPAALSMFGYRADEVVGQNISMLMPEPYRNSHDNYIESYLTSGNAKIIGIGREVVGQRKDGSVFPMDLSVGEVRLAGARLFTGILRDITERKNAEARLAQLAVSLAEKNKDLEAVVYAASHDLRSPLINIQGFAHELSRTCATIRNRLAAPDFPNSGSNEIHRLLREDAPEAIGFILSGVAKMNALLTGFLRYSRLGHIPIQIQKLDMNQLVSEVARAMEFEIKQSGVDLQLANLPPCYGDPTQIGQVFSNLLANALKYRDPSRPGKIVISGTISGSSSLYRIRDNGIGIDPQHRPKIFEMFYRLNPAASEGEGLGLSIAQRILQKHNGAISVESEPGQGSEFSVTLPNTAPENAK